MPTKSFRPRSAPPLSSGAGLVLFALATVLGSCAPPTPPGSPLDYAEIRESSGWSLRIRGDGSGSLRHDQLPAHHLHYPEGTFDPGPARALVRNCRGTEDSVRRESSKVSTYSARANLHLTCGHAPPGWSDAVMHVAFAEMDHAVDAGASLRSCRMFRRVALRGSHRR